MAPSRHVAVHVDLACVRRNAEEISRTTHRGIIAVVKADAYGLGAAEVAETLRDFVDKFAVFHPDEAAAAKIWQRTGKFSIAIGPPAWNDPARYSSLHIQPAVSTVEQAQALARAQPVLCVDTGQQRFACPIIQVAEAVKAGQCREAFTHATRLEQVRQLQAAANHPSIRLHAAGSSLLHEPDAWLDAVRPGLALYRGAARVSTRLVEVRESTGPAGYSGFAAPRHGIILCGYSNGLRAGPCAMNGRRSSILEVGMQSAFVEVTDQDKVGDEVVLLGEGLTEEEIALDWNTSPHEVLVRLSGSGLRSHSTG